MTIQSTARARALSLTILMPVRNERMNLRIMLKILRAVVDVPHEVVVVYDSPDDESAPIVEEIGREYPNLRGVLNQTGRGAFNAIKAGIDAATGDVLLLFMADEVGPVLAIEEMLDLIEEGCDLVNATRYAHGGRRLGGSLVEGTLSRIGNRLFRLVSGSILSDGTTGVKMFRRGVFERLALESPAVGWCFAFEMTIKAQAKGLRLGEVPIISIDRLYGGKSTFQVLPWMREYSKWFVRGTWLLRTRAVARTRSVALRIPDSVPVGGSP